MRGPTPRLLLSCLLALACVLAACRTAHQPLNEAEQARLQQLLPADLVLLGEQHDADAHQQLERQLIDWLAGHQALAAVVIEMAEQGRSTRGLPASASEHRVRQALAWSDSGWPWKRYGPVVMSAVRAGVPVLGANWPQARLREAMADTRLDQLLDADTLRRHRELIDESHCRLLPARHLPGMTRVQIARDQAMAQTAAEAHEPGRTVLLIAGGGHVHRALAVPRHLPPQLQTRVLLARTQAAADPAAMTDGLDADALLPGDLLWPTPALAPRDHCAELEALFRSRPAPSR